MPISEDEFRDISNRLAKGVAVVTARSRGHDIARTVTDVIAVSWDPPTMLVSLYSLGRIAEAVEEAGVWALSFLTAAQQPVASWLAEPGAPLVGLLDPVPHWRLGPDGPAIVSGALAWMVVETTQAHEIATHTLFAGAVVAMGAADGADATEPGGGASALAGQAQPTRALSTEPLLRYCGEYLDPGR